MFFTKTLKNMQNIKLFSLSMQMQYDIIKINTASFLFSNRKYKEREKN